MKKSRIITIALCILLAGGFFFAGQHLFIADNTEDLTVDKGVYIGGIDVGGMSAQEATDTLNAYVENLKAQTITFKGPKGNIELTLGDMGLTAKIDTAVDKATGTAKAGNLISRFMLLKDLESENVVIDMGLSIDKQATGNLIHNQLDELNIEAVDWDLKREDGKFIFVEGKTGEEVDIVASVNALSEYIAKDWQNGAIEGAEFTLTSAVTNPRGSEEELAKVKDLLGTFSTDFSSSNAGRKKNVTNGCSKINGTLLYPGDTFSAYKATSPYTEKNGYGVGGAYSGGKLVESMGGGICQVSTTLYNAAIRAELKITQRNAHSMTVSYVDPSVDAAIAGTYKDLKFRNDYDFPIYIEGYCKKGILTFNIYGLETRAANRTIRFE
ncbi:MAG: VanW family protein, partial [Agathobacter sp.]|nr:VanW family protein [Agathobacter sp.]